MPLDLDALVIGPTVSVWGEKGQGKPVPVYRPASGGAFEMDGVFDAQYSSIRFSDGAAISTVSPMLGVRASDFPPSAGPLQGDRITIRNGIYVVTDVNPDSHGWIKLILMQDDQL